MYITEVSNSFYNRVWPEIGTGVIWAHENADANSVTLTLKILQVQVSNGVYNLYAIQKQRRTKGCSEITLSIK